jgi:hypothetical protein
MTSYPYRTEDEQEALDHLPNSPYAFDDLPFINTQRYCLSGYEPRDVQRKAMVDCQGAKDMVHSLEQWKESTQ